MNRTTPYDNLAWFYNQYWSISIPELMKEMLDTLLLPHLDAGASILDVCCGAGHLAKRVQDEGFAVHGVDISAKMIDYARLNAPECRFTVADASQFRSEERFDAAYSVFDSINHIPDTDTLRALFTSVHASLKEDAPFLFDINSATCIQTCGDNGFSVVQDDNICIVRPYYEPESGNCVYDITTFLLTEGKWERDDIQVREWYYPVEQIFDLLAEAGFTSMQAVEASQFLDDELGGRIFILAHT